MEVWKDVKDYEGLYVISNLGRIRSTSGQYTGRILSPTDNGKGYKIVGLSKNGNRQNHYVHRLIAIAFIDNPNNFKEINHIDENQSNNCPSNLEWCNRKYNCNYGNHCAKLSNSMKGKVAWNKGIPHSQETKDKIKAKAKERRLRGQAEQLAFA